eukprot:TRINITY_DN6471_c0_g1_i1.p1 TRINITY_DN6471_c0_g1~~TRINITY_DN6471_c0_g1_i1.p1  ORF type:complete len:690 (+),score=234.03 TRINITY_DN6471_c0_g1_i1:45-2072(+)
MDSEDDTVQLQDDMVQLQADLAAQRAVTEALQRELHWCRQSCARSLALAAEGRAVSVELVRAEGQQRVIDGLDFALDSLQLGVDGGHGAAECVTRLEEENAALRSAQQDLKAELGAALTKLDAARAAADEELAAALAAAKEQAAEQLATADTKAAERLAAAERDAATKLADAQNKAADQLAAAEQGAAERLAAAEKRAAEQLAAAQNKAADQVAAAEKDAAALLEVAEKDAAAKLAAVEVERDDVAKLAAEQLAAVKGQTAAELASARQAAADWEAAATEGKELLSAAQRELTESRKELDSSKGEATTAKDKLDALDGRLQAALEAAREAKDDLAARTATDAQRAEQASALAAEVAKMERDLDWQRTECSVVREANRGIASVMQDLKAHLARQRDETASAREDAKQARKEAKLAEAEATECKKALRDALHDVRRRRPSAAPDARTPRGVPAAKGTPSHEAVRGSSPTGAAATQQGQVGQGPAARPDATTPRLPDEARGLASQPHFAHSYGYPSPTVRAVHSWSVPEHPRAANPRGSPVPFRDDRVSPSTAAAVAGRHLAPSGRSSPPIVSPSRIHIAAVPPPTRHTVLQVPAAPRGSAHLLSLREAPGALPATPRDRPPTDVPTIVQQQLPPQRVYSTASPRAGLYQVLPPASISSPYRPTTQMTAVERYRAALG